MKKKKLWIPIVAIAVLMPTLILCALMLTSDDFSLENFADCSSLSVVDAEGATVTLEKGEENFLLLTRLLAAAHESQAKNEGKLSSRLYTVRVEDGDETCYLGIEDGQAAVEWKGMAYLLSYPHLKALDTVMYPRIVRYGVKGENGYLNAPTITQSTDLVYSVNSAADFLKIAFDCECVSSVEILFYEQGTENVAHTFSDFEQIVFDESKDWTVIVNAELEQNGYRVQCGYEFFYSCQE